MTRKSRTRRSRTPLLLCASLILGICGMSQVLGLGRGGRGRIVKRLWMVDEPEGGASDGGLYESDEERTRAVQYNRLRERLVLVGMVWSGLLSLLALVSGFSAL